MTIHAIINHFTCPNEDCTETVTLTLAQISEDHKHDSFVARAGHDAAFKYLSGLGLQLEEIIQFCDNCASQYKSRKPFIELACSSLNITCVFFGEKHGKSLCNGFFGRLKSWMTHKIKSRQVIINNATDFFRYCKAEYEMPEVQPGMCQHYRVIFQFLQPSDIRRHQDCTLDEAITGTRSIYSVRNTPEVLKLQVCNIPCLCLSCTSGNGTVCENSNYADVWREVDLVPVKGQNKSKYRKRKTPSATVNVQSAADVDNNNDKILSDEHLPEIVLNDVNEPNEEDITVDLTTPVEGDGELFIDLTEEQGTQNADMCMEAREDDDVIISVPQSTIPATSPFDKITTQQIADHDERIPDKIYWESLLGVLEKCTNDFELESMAREIQKKLKPIRKRKSEVYFNPQVDSIDTVTYDSIPEDGPKDLIPIKVLPDGNCLSRSLSHGYIGNDSMHLEIRTRIAVESIVNKRHYITHACLRRGSTMPRDEETLPILYCQYSDHYVNGQKITENTVDYIYAKEVHDCMKVNSYMGLWQIAQASTVLDIPIKSMYPTGSDPIMRLDFNRTFYPLNRTSNKKAW